MQATSPSRATSLRRVVPLLALAAAGMAFGAHVSDARATARQVATVRFIKSGLSVTPPHKKASRAKLHQKLYGAYRLQTKAAQKASLAMADRSFLHINQRSDLTLRSATVTAVRQGEVYVIDALGSHHTIQTATVSAVAIGTEYDVLVQLLRGKPQTVISVVKGSVLAQNAGGSVQVGAGERLTVRSKTAIPAPIPLPAGAGLNWISGIPAPSVPTPTAAPTKTPRPPTATSVPPSATSVPPTPTATSVPPTSIPPTPKPTKTPRPTSTPVPTRTPTGTVTFDHLTTYAESTQNCDSQGEQQTMVVSTQSPAICAKAFLSDWTGKHTETWEWQRPDGSLQDFGPQHLTQLQYTHTGSGGPTVSELAMPIAEYSSAQYPGTWTVRYSLDGTLTGSIQFDMH